MGEARIGTGGAQKVQNVRAVALESTKYQCVFHMSMLSSYCQGRGVEPILTTNAIVPACRIIYRACIYVMIRSPLIGAKGMER